METINQNELKARAEWQRILDESLRAGGTLGREAQEQERLNKLTPEEQKASKRTEEQLDWAIRKKDVLSINEIVRSSSAKKLLSPEALRKAFAVLRSIHMEESKKHVDNANLGAIRDDITNRLDTVSTGYHELFKNLQGHIETTGPIHEESGENLVDLQSEVEEAEVSIQQLLTQLNRVGSAPVPGQIPIQDMPPSWNWTSESENPLKF